MHTTQEVIFQMIFFIKFGKSNILSLLSPIHIVTHPYCHPSLLSPIPIVTHPYCHPSQLSPIPIVTHPNCHPSLLSPIHMQMEAKFFFSPGVTRHTTERNAFENSSIFIYRLILKRSINIAMQYKIVYILNYFIFERKT